MLGVCAGRLCQQVQYYYSCLLPCRQKASANRQRVMHMVCVHSSGNGISEPIKHGSSTERQYKRFPSTSFSVTLSSEAKSFSLFFSLPVAFLCENRSSSSGIGGCYVILFFCALRISPVNTDSKKHLTPRLTQHSAWLAVPHNAKHHPDATPATSLMFLVLFTH